MISSSEERSAEALPQSYDYLNLRDTRSRKPEVLALCRAKSQETAFTLATHDF